MQEIIVLVIAAAAFIYLFIKFIAKRKSHDCTDCGLSESKDLKEH